jgi:hypothetical protein
MGPPGVPQINKPPSIGAPIAAQQPVKILNLPTGKLFYKNILKFYIFFSTKTSC